ALHALERALELVELVRAADQRRPEPQRGEPPPGSGLGHGAEETMDDDRLGLTAKRDLSAGLEREAMARQRVGRLGHENRAGRRGGQEARGRVHGVAGHGIRGAGRDAEAAGDDRTAVDADVERYALAEARGPAISEPGGALEH